MLNPFIKAVCISDLCSLPLKNMVTHCKQQHMHEAKLVTYSYFEYLSPLNWMFGVFCQGVFMLLENDEFHKLLWNHLNLWGPFFVVCQFFTGS